MCINLIMVQQKCGAVFLHSWLAAIEGFVQMQQKSYVLIYLKCNLKNGRLFQKGTKFYQKSLSFFKNFETPLILRLDKFFI